MEEILSSHLCEFDLIQAASSFFCFQSFLKHKDARPLRDVLAANPNRFITLLLPGGAQTAVRPGSPSTSNMRLDLQFQAIKVGHLH